MLQPELSSGTNAQDRRNHPHSPRVSSINSSSSRGYPASCPDDSSLRQQIRASGSSWEFTTVWRSFDRTKPPNPLSLASKTMGLIYKNHFAVAGFTLSPGNAPGEEITLLLAASPCFRHWKVFFFLNTNYIFPKSPGARNQSF